MTNHLVVFLDELYTRVGRRYYGRHATLLFVLQLAQHFDAATLMVNVRDQGAPGADEPLVADLSDSRLEVVELPPYRSLAGSLAKLPAVAGTFWRRRREIDSARTVFIRVPSLMGLLFGEFCRLRGRDPWYHVCANLETQANPIRRGGSGEGLWKILARSLSLLQHVAVRGLRMSAVGAELEEKFSRGVPLVPRPRAVFNHFESLLGEAMLFRRPDTCRGPEIRLLRVCQLDHSKGMEVLLPAVRILREQGLPVRLEVVGGGAPDYLRRLKDLAASLGLTPVTTWLGPLTYGDLLRTYREADLQVLSSWGEGLPRVILEGWGSCLPLVSTAVGGIPRLVTHEESGLLVPPGDPEALAREIARLIRDGELRRRLIARGFALAQEYSQERQTARLAALLRA
ncbi:MAG: glycosyltransferase [Deltaproteobacteria bacterium]|nr:glycosyltransferase [Deltaproteobacteria bacterium]